jgi:hypothetical protein
MNDISGATPETLDVAIGCVFSRPMVLPLSYTGFYTLGAP